MSQISRTSILLKALRHLQEAPLMNGQVDQRPVTRMLNESYEVVRDEMLRQHLWNFATKRASLNPLFTPPASGWATAYQVPDDWLVTYPITDDGTFDGTIISHAIEGRTIVTNTTGILQIAYVASVPEALFTADFANALSARLAADCSSSVTGKANLSVTLGSLYGNLLQTAINNDRAEDRQRFSNPILVAAYRHIFAGKGSGAGDGDSIAYDLMLNYQDTLQEALELHPWNFATVRQVLVADDMRPAFGFRYRFAKPDGLLRLSQPTLNGLWEAPNVPYRVEGDWIVSNIGPRLDVVFVTAGTPVAKMPAAFRRYVAARLALSVITGTERAQLAGVLGQVAASALNDARMNDSVQGTLESPQEDFWEKARFGIGGVSGTYFPVTGTEYDDFFSGR